MSLIYTDGGNWGELEASASAQYRKSFQMWSKSYSRLCLEYNTLHTVTIPNGKEIDLSLLNENVKPKEHQEDLIRIMINTGRLACFAGLGAGKTFIGTVAAVHLMSYKEKVHNRFLVIARKSIINEWVSQIPRFVPSSVAVFPEDGTINADFVVTNYEQLEKLIPYREYFSGIIVDESHNFSNISSLRFKNLMNFVDGHIMYRFVMTGSPIQNKPDGLFPQLCFVNPYAFGISYSFLLKRYFNISGPGAKRQKTIKMNGKPLFARAVTENAILTATPRDDLYVVDPVMKPVPLSQVQKKYLTAVESGHLIVTKLGDTGNTSMRQKLKNSLSKEFQISSGFLYAGDDTIEFPSTKLSEAIKLAKATDERIILWVYFKKTAETLKKVFGQEADVIVGGMTKASIADVKRRFEEKDFRVLIASIETANAGLNLQFCRNAVFIEYSWAPSVMEQAIGRMDRPGQTRKCNIWFLYTEGTADELPIVAYHNKTSVNSSILVNFVKKRAIPPIRRKKRNSNLATIGL